LERLDKNIDVARREFYELIAPRGWLKGIFTEPEYRGTQMVIDQAKARLDVGDIQGFREKILVLEGKIQRVIIIHHLAEQFLRVLIIQTLSSKEEVNEENALARVFEQVRGRPSMRRLWWARLYQLIMVPLSVEEKGKKKDNPLWLAIDELIERMKLKVFLESQQQPVIDWQEGELEGLIAVLVQDFELSKNGHEALLSAARVSKPTEVPLTFLSTYAVGYFMYWLGRNKGLVPDKLNKRIIDRFIREIIAPSLEAPFFQFFPEWLLMILHGHLQSDVSPIAQKRREGIHIIKQRIQEGKKKGWRVSFRYNINAHRKYNKENPDAVLTFGLSGLKEKRLTNDEDAQKKKEKEKERERILEALILLLLLLIFIAFLFFIVWLWLLYLCSFTSKAAWGLGNYRWIPRQSRSDVRWLKVKTRGINSHHPRMKQVLTGICLHSLVPRGITSVRYPGQEAVIQENTGANVLHWIEILSYELPYIYYWRILYLPSMLYIILKEKANRIFIRKVPISPFALGWMVKKGLSLVLCWYSINVVKYRQEITILLKEIKIIAGREVPLFTINIDFFEIPSTVLRAFAELE
jgi:hypothetical protein